MLTQRNLNVAIYCIVAGYMLIKNRHGGCCVKSYAWKSWNKNVLPDGAVSKIAHVVHCGSQNPKVAGKFEEFISCTSSLIRHFTQEKKVWKGCRHVYILPPPHQNLGGLVVLHMKELWFIVSCQCFFENTHVRAKAYVGTHDYKSTYAGRLRPDQQAHQTFCKTLHAGFCFMLKGSDTTDTAKDAVYTGIYSNTVH